MKTTAREKTPLSELGEFALIERLCRNDGSLEQLGIIGPGDDCAVLPVSDGNDSWQLITTDSLIEGVHFRRDYSSLKEIGHKSLAVSLSDIAAMGGRPEAVVIALQLPGEISVEEVEELYEGIYQLAEMWNVYVVGGDTVSAKQLGITTTVIGKCSHAPVMRSGAKTGEDLWVSGVVGRAEIGLRLLGGAKLELSREVEQCCLDRHRCPEPRVKLGIAFGEQGLATAMIDVSDGLLQDAGHIARKSEVNVVMDLETIPIDSIELDRGELLTGGDDYELLFTAPHGKRGDLENLSGSEKFGVQLTRIGKVEEGNEGVVSEAGELLAKCGKERGGYQHF